MSTVVRQQALLVAEAWQNIYTNQSYVDFQSYNQDNLVNAILNYVQINYPDNYNDWITNSEFVIKVRTLAWLHQNISYRIDLDVRENFIQTATRRDAILMLAENVFYKPNRVTGATGELRVESILTNQTLVDSNGENLANVDIFWNDPAGPDWFEQFTLVMNAALTPRTQFGHPLSRYNNPPSRTDVYMFNSRAPSGGVYPFSVQVADTVLPFGYINVTMDKDTGVLSELPPDPTSALRIIYRSDGRGSGSPNTGFFLPIRQGILNSFDEIFSVPQTMEQVVLGNTNVDNGDVFVQQIDSAGNVILNWTEVASLYGQGVSFNNLNSDTQTIFETHTLINDQVRVQFGDGKFGAIPTDGFRFWYRTVNPVPLSVQPSDVQRQSFVIPYVSNGALYFLTVRASLVAPITNAIPTDSNDTIKANMGGAYAAQRRMVTAADYNLFPMGDSSILKLKAVNRTYSGHSAYAKIYDPTGLYNGIKVLAEDGRLYRDDSRKSTFVSALTSQVTLDELVLQDITPLIQSSDKQALYYNRYDEILCIDNPTWSQTSVSNGVSSGNVHKPGIIPVGPTATDEFRYLVPGTIIRYTSLAGPIISVQQVRGDGTGADGISLTGTLATSTILHSLMPPLRNFFTVDEQSDIKAQLFNLQDFGLSWNQSLQEWVIVANANLNKSGSFDISQQGDTSSTGKDASWMVYLRYIPNGGDGPLWEIFDRGMGIFFESSREVEFVYVNTGPVVNPDTGRLVHDNINILGSNEGRDSLSRLGLYRQGPCCPLIYNFTANGIDTCYQIRNAAPQDEIFVFVDNKLAIYCTDYKISQTPIGDEICFYTAPLYGQTISIRVDGPYRYATQYLVSATGDGATALYNIGDGTLQVENTILSLDGVTQRGGIDYYVTMQDTLASFQFSAVPANGVHIQGYAESGPQTSLFMVLLYPGDGITTVFDTGYAGQTIDKVMIFIDGIWQTAGLDYAIDNDVPPHSRVRFTTAPSIGATISMHVCPIPGFVASSMYTAVGNGVTTFFSVPTLNSIGYHQLIVGLNGIVQHEGDFTISATGITFDTAPLVDNRVEIFVLRGLVGYVFLEQDNTCYTSYLRDDKIFNVTGVDLTPDGYTDIDGVEVLPADSNLDGIPDNPNEFDDILIPDGLTDLVLWRSVIKDGFAVWNPIDETTVPKGTYGFSNVTLITENALYGITTTTAGDIHLDQTTGKWLVADGFTKTWVYNEQAQPSYKSAIGRSGLKFIWTHYPADDTRIDPAISNIIDMFVLPVSYDTAYRQWIGSGFIGAAPDAPTAQSLQNEYAYLNNYRMTDDSLIFRSINYRPLFGAIAETQYQGTFLAIKSPASLLSDNDLILRIINAIDIFFQAPNWELGESFYLTEMIAFIHRVTAPDLQSVVLVSKDGSQPFGDMFQIRSSPDEIFISVAQPADVKIVTSFNADNLQILSTAF